MIEILIILIIIFFAGLSIGFFLKKLAKLFLFFIGYYLFLSLLLVYTGVISITINWQVFTTAYNTLLQGLGGGSGILDKLRNILTTKYVLFALAGLVGFAIGLKKG